jgi:AcrR family transcriptional regulator
MRTAILAVKRRRQEERAALSDRAMTEAAVSLLVERGIAGTTLASVGERAGYSRGLVTHRFGSKAGLLAHVHDSVAAEWLRHVNRFVGESTGISALQGVVDALYDFMLNEPEGLRALYLLRYPSIDPSADYRANVAKLNRAQVRALSQWIDPRLASEVFASVLDGLLYRWLVNPDLPVKQLHVIMRAHVDRSLRRVD